MYTMCNFLLLLLLVATIQGRIVLQPTPDSVLPGITPQLGVRCSLSPDSADTNRVMVIQIEKLNGIHLRPLASVTTGESAKLDIQFARQHASVTGMIHSANPRDSFLQLKLVNPNEEDAGLYECAISMLDENFLLDKQTVQANVSLIGSENNGQVSEFVFQQLQSLREEIANLAEKLQNSSSGTTASKPSQLVAFTAKPASRRPFQIGKLMFETVEVNDGGAYDSGTSSFVAPVNGTYVMMAAVSCREGKTITEMKVNGDTKAQLPTVEDDQTSVSLVLKLQAGDRVWLDGIYDSHNDTGTIVYADNDTLFSGYLLDY